MCGSASEVIRRATIRKGVEIALDGKGDCDRMLNVLWGRPRSAEHLNS